MGGRRRWTQRSCRTASGGGGGGVVRWTVAAERAAGWSPARRPSEGFAHADKQRRVHGVLSDSRCSSGSAAQEYYLSSDLGEFKHKRSSGNPTRCQSREHVRNEIEIRQPPPVMAKLMGFDAATEDGGVSQKKSSSIKESHFSSNKNLLHMSGTDSPSLRNLNGVSNFRYGLTRSDESYSSKMSANHSLLETMTILRRRGKVSSHHNLNYTGALSARHKNMQSGGAIDVSRKDVDKNPDSSVRSYWQGLLENAVVRQNHLYHSEPHDHEFSKQLWSSANSDSEKVVCFSSNDSIDDLQTSLSTDTSDTSDSSKISTLSSSESSMGKMANDQWEMTFQKVYCTLPAHVHSMSLTDRKEIEQPSPVSVLEPPAEESSNSGFIKLDMADPHELQLRLELVEFPSMETTTEGIGIGGSDYCFETELSSKNEAIQLVEDILEEFGDEEEREFSYLLDMLIASGIHGTEEDQLYKVCYSLDCPVGHGVFDKLEKKYMNVAQWSRSDRKLLFDMQNSILSEILCPCLDLQPWVNTTRKMVPMWGSEGLLEKVLQMLAQRREELAQSKRRPDKKALDQRWPDLAGYIDTVGRDIERMIKDDLLEELLLELLFDGKKF